MLIFGSALNPVDEQLFLCRTERLLEFRRRHDLFRIVTQDAANHFALIRFSRTDRTMLNCRVALVHSEIGFASRTVRPVARQTRVHENWTNVTIELDCILSIDNSR